MVCGQPVGSGHPPFVIAELSANHNGDINAAFEIIHHAAASGAKALKFQHYTPDTLTNTFSCTNCEGDTVQNKKSILRSVHKKFFEIIVTTSSC